MTCYMHACRACFIGGMKVHSMMALQIRPKLPAARLDDFRHPLFYQILQTEEVLSIQSVGRSGHRFPDAKRCSGCQYPSRSRLAWPPLLSWDEGMKGEVL